MYIYIYVSKGYYERQKSEKDDLKISCKVSNWISESFFGPYSNYITGPS